MTEDERATNRDVIGQVAHHREDWDRQMTNTMTKDLLDVYEADLKLARVWATERPRDPRVRARYRQIYSAKVRGAGERFAERMAQIDPSA